MESGVSSAPRKQKYRITKSGIGASNLNYGYRFVLNVGGSTAFDATVSVMTYVKAMLDLTDATEAEQKAMAALYQYYAQAAAYQQ